MQSRERRLTTLNRKTLRWKTLTCTLRPYQDVAQLVTTRSGWGDIYFEQGFEEAFESEFGVERSQWLKAVKDVFTRETIVSKLCASIEVADVLSRHFGPKFASSKVTMRGPDVLVYSINRTSNQAKYDPRLEVRPHRQSLHLNVVRPGPAFLPPPSSAWDAKVYPRDTP